MGHNFLLKLGDVDTRLNNNNNNNTLLHIFLYECLSVICKNLSVLTIGIKELIKQSEYSQNCPQRPPLRTKK